MSRAADQQSNTKKSGPWLNAWHDPVAGMKAYSNGLAFSDLHSDNNYFLLIADHNMKLKAYRGTSLITQQDLVEPPAALCAFYSDSGATKTPSVAVACGACVYIYRNMRPFYKFTVPEARLGVMESEVWTSLKDSSMLPGDIINAVDKLKKARENGENLAPRSTGLIATEDPTTRESHIKEWINQPLSESPCVCTMSSLKRLRDDPDSTCMLVIGLENGHILFLDPPGSVTTVVQLPSASTHISVSGKFEVEYRVVVACRNGKVYTIKNGESRHSAVVTGTIIDVESQILAIARHPKCIHLSTMDKHIHCMYAKGRKMYSIVLPACASDLQAFERQGQECLLAALQCGEVRLYNGKSCIHTLYMHGNVPTALCFGRFGREESALAIISENGSLTLKFLDRRANLAPLTVDAGPPPEQDTPLNIPAKTRLYVEQTQRERDQAGDMHRIFQRDLCRLRLATARAYVSAVTSGGTCPVSTIRLTAECRGLGPNFKLRITLVNSSNKSIIGACIAFTFDMNLYRLESGVISVPVLIPSVPTCVQVGVRSIDSMGTAGSIKAIVLLENSTKPAIFAVINMPPSELAE